MSQVRNEAARASGSSRHAIRLPMHPEVVSNTADKCPKCGMKLVAANLVGQNADHAHHEHAEHDHDHSHHGEGHAHETPQGIEWEDDMLEVNG